MKSGRVSGQACGLVPGRVFYWGREDRNWTLALEEMQSRQKMTVYELVPELVAEGIPEDPDLEEA